MTKIKVDPNFLYDSLNKVLQGAYKQASEGKGKERHADAEPFENQKICVINRWIADSPVAGALFQAVKKTVESSRLSDSAAIHELQGAINYLAAAIILLEERPKEKAEKEPVKLSMEQRVCSHCVYVSSLRTDMPCKKCMPWEFKPHFRLRP